MDIEYDALVGLLTILAVGIFTPGPNNITAISHSAVHGARSNISLLIGMVIGFVSVHLIIGSVIEQIDEESVFFSFLEWFGIFFFVALGIIILRLPIERLSSIKTSSDWISVMVSLCNSSMEKNGPLFR